MKTFDNDKDWAWDAWYEYLRGLKVGEYSMSFEEFHGLETQEDDMEEEDDVLEGHEDILEEEEEDGHEDVEADELQVQEPDEYFKDETSSESETLDRLQDAGVDQWDALFN